MANKDVSLDSSEVQELERVFGTIFPRELRKSMRRALSRTRTGARKSVSDHIREDFNVLAGRVRQDTVLLRPNYARMEFRVIGRNRTISMMNFRGKSGPPRQVATGVSVAVRQKKREVIRHAFIAPDLRGKPRVFTRWTRDGQPMPKHYPDRGRYSAPGIRYKRQKLRALKGPSVADMMETAGVYEPLAEEAQSRFMTELSRNLKFFLGR